MQTPTIQQVPASKIVAGLNDRETFNRSELEALAANIREYGLLQPPVYRPLADGTYQIVAGERRTRAMRDILGWPLIPCIVNEALADDADAVGAMGSENRCRVNLNPLEEAQGYHNGMARYGWDTAECARRNGVSTRTVSDRLALLTLCPEAQDLVSKPGSGFTVGYALVLASAGLDRNFQNNALDLLKVNRSPNLDWWRATVAELVLKAGQNSMFDLADFMVAKQEEIAAQNEASLPNPDTAEAPVVGTTAEEILTNQAEWWSNLGAQYKAQGKKPEARVCQANARMARANADLIARMAAMASPVVPAPVAIEPELAPMAPVVSDPDVLAVDALVGRVGRVVCHICSKRATHEVTRREVTGDSQRRRMVIRPVCNDHLPTGHAPQVGPAPQQLQFMAVAA